MNPKYLLSGLIGAVVGAVGTYFVLEYMHDKEIQSIYADIEEADDEYHTLVAGYTGSDEEIDEEVDGIIVDRRLIHVVDDETATDDLIEEDVVEGEGDEDETDPPEIFIIDNDQVSGNQVIMEYNRDDGGVVINRTMSINTDSAASLDEFIDNETLLSLIDEEAMATLKRSRARKSTDPRLLCVRNHILNLDFVISY